MNWPKVISYPAGAHGVDSASRWLTSYVTSTIVPSAPSPRAPAARAAASGNMIGNSRVSPAATANRQSACQCGSPFTSMRAVNRSPSVERNRLPLAIATPWPFGVIVTFAYSRLTSCSFGVGVRSANTRPLPENS